MSVGISGWFPINSFLSLIVRDELGGSVGSAALLLIAIQSGTATLGLASGACMRWIGTRWTYALGLAGMAMFTMLLSLTTGVGAVLVAAPIMGMSLGLHWAASQTYVLEITPPSRRGLAMGVMSFVIIAAPGVTGIGFGALAESFGFGLMAGVASGTIGVALLLVVLCLPSTTARSQGAREARGNMLRTLGNRQVLAMVIARASTTVAFGVVVLLTGPKLVDAGGDLKTVGVFILVSAIGGAFAQIAIGHLSDAIGRQGVFALSLIVGAAAAVGLARSNDIVPLLTFSGVIFLAFGSHQTLLPAIAGDIVEPGRIPAAMALQTSAFGLGVAAGAAATAVLASTDGNAAFYAGAAGMGIALLTVPWLRRLATDASPPS